MTAYEIPLTPNPQRFSIPLGGVVYNLVVRWCTGSASWVLDVADTDGVALVGSIPLVTGVDLLGQYRYLGFKGSLEVQSDANLTDVPDFTNLGTQGHLYFIPDAT